MQNGKTMTKALCIIFISGIVFQSTAGCGRGGQQQNMQLQAAQEKQTEEKESEKLKKIEDQIEKLFEALGGPSVQVEEAGGNKEGEGNKQGTQQGGGDGTQQQGTKQQGTQQGGGGGTQQQGTQQSGGQGTQQQSTQQQGTKHQNSGQKKGGQQTQQNAQQPENWSEVDKLINNLHFQWNEFMPEIAKKGADMKLVDNFDNALNNLTTTVQSKEKEKVLASANTLYSYIPQLYSLYRVKMSPEAKRLIYHTRNIILVSAKGDWEQVGKDNEAIEKSWSLFRNTLEKEQKQTGDKLDFSIYELKKVSEEKNKQLCGIKGKIVLANIKELQKSFAESK